MKTPGYIKQFFLLPAALFIAGNSLSAQLTIDAGTKWVGDSNTYVTLDALGLRYNADADNLDNTFIFSGSNNVFIESNTTPNLRTVIIDKAANQLLLNADVNIYHKVRFKSGFFNLNNHTVALSPVAYLENENESSRFIDTNYGSVKISVNVTAPVNVNPGNIGATISSSSYNGSITVFRGHHPQSINSPVYANNSIARYYTIFLEDKANINATLRLSYFDAEKNGLDENKFVIWQPTEGGWVNIGASAKSTVLNYVQQKAINSFGTFVIAPYDIVLAVSGLNLSGIWKNNTSLLTFSTLTEINNDHFEIERKYPSDNNYVKVATVTSKHADGNSQSLTSYMYADAAANLNAPEILYRIKQVDKNGSSIWSNTIVIKPNYEQQFIVNIYPTITIGRRLFIKTGSMLNVEKMQVDIFDMSGKRLFSQALPYQSQWLTLPSLSAGMYKITIQSGELRYNNSFIK